MILTFLDENIKKCNKFKNENDLISDLKLGHGQNDIYILRVLMLAQRQENQTNGSIWSGSNKNSHLVSTSDPSQHVASNLNQFLINKSCQT